MIDSILHKLGRRGRGSSNISNITRPSRVGFPDMSGKRFELFP